MQASQHSSKSLPGSQKPYFKEQIPDPLMKSPFSLSLANKLIGYDLFVVSYSQKHQLILVSSLDGSLFCYDAKTLPARKVKTHRLDGSALYISYSQESDTFIIGCNSGLIYTYQVSSDQLKIEQRPERGGNKSRSVVEFLDSSHYAFGFDQSKWLAIGKLDDNVTTKFDLEDSHCSAIHHYSDRNLLFSGLSNGFVRIFVTKQLPKLKAFCLFQAHEAGKQVNAIQSLQVDGKEYVVTSSEDGTIRLCHFVKGKMKVLKVIREKISSFFYLKEYRLLVTDSEQSNGICFWKLPCGKLERRLDYSTGFWRGNLLLLEDKNIIAYVASGAVRSSADAIELMEIHPE